jgi:hypothetical protein
MGPYLGAANFRMNPPRRTTTTNVTVPPPDPAGPKRAAPASPFTKGQLNALSDRRARAIVEMLMPKANRALKLAGKRVVIVDLENGA